MDAEQGARENTPQDAALLVPASSGSRLVDALAAQVDEGRRGRAARLAAVERPYVPVEDPVAG